MLYLNGAHNVIWSSGPAASLSLEIADDASTALAASGACGHKTFWHSWLHITEPADLNWFICALFEFNAYTWIFTTKRCKDVSA
eukprot:357102-Chlamydomonas_euryale.AAC.8